MAGAASWHEAVDSLKMKHTANSSLDMREYALLSSYRVRHLHLVALEKKFGCKCLDIRRVAQG